MLKRQQIITMIIMLLGVTTKFNIINVKSPLVIDQVKGVKRVVLMLAMRKELMQCINNASILAQTKLEVMQQAVAKCPGVSISAYGIQIPSLLDSGSEVTLLWQSYIEQYLLENINLVTSEKAKTHSLFRPRVTKVGQLPIKMYTEPGITFLGLKVPKVGVLIAEDPNQVLDKKHQTRLPGNVGNGI